MWGAADGAVKLIEGLMPNIEALEGYPHTAELGAAYRASFPVMLEGATQIRDSITAGIRPGSSLAARRSPRASSCTARSGRCCSRYINDALKMKRLARPVVHHRIRGVRLWPPHAILTRDRRREPSVRMGDRTTRPAEDRSI